MTKVVVTAQVEDTVKWEEGFRTHSDLFRSQTITDPIDMGVTDNNEVAVCFEVANLDTFFQIMDSPATAEAMAVDGIVKDSVKVYVLDKEFQP